MCRVVSRGKYGIMYNVEIQQKNIGHWRNLVAFYFTQKGVDKMRKEFHPDIAKFYKSRKWKNARQIKILNAHGRCEKCGGVGTEVHHIVHLTPENIFDTEVTINQKNLMLLCTECHNKMHHRWGGKNPYGFDEEGNFIKK